MSTSSTRPFRSMGTGSSCTSVSRPDHRYDEAHDVLFATGAAMVVRTDVFRSAGGFDDRYFMFFEDVDFGWRLWLLGWRVRFVPHSVVFHRHHASMAKFKNWREQYLLERNALYTIYKNYDDRTLARVLPAALALSVRRGVALGGVDTHTLDLERGISGEDDDLIPMPKSTAASVYAVDAFVENIGSLRESRDEIQRRRQRGDHELTKLFRLPLHPNINEPSFTGRVHRRRRTMNIEGLFGTRHKIAIATGDSLTPRMAGPAIRAWQIALALSREHDVKLVSTVKAELTHPDFEVYVIDPASMAELEAWCDVFVFQGYILHEYPVIRDSNKVIVCDIYDPFHLEQLEQARDLGEKLRKDTVLGASYVLNQQLTRATSSSARATSSATSGSASWRRSAASIRRTTMPAPTCPSSSNSPPSACPTTHRANCGPRSKVSCRASRRATRSSSGAAASTTGSIR